MKINAQSILNAIAISLALMLSSCGDESTIKYQSTLSEGIDFRREGYPDFLVEVSGVDGKEDWGRWTNKNLAPSAKFLFKDALPNKFALEFQAIPFGANAIVPVKVGNITQNLILDGGNGKVNTLIFENTNGANSIEIIPKNPISPIELNPNSPDTRKIAVGLTSLRIKPIN